MRRYHSKDLKDMKTKKQEDLLKELGKKKDEAMKAWTQIKAGKEKNLKAVRNTRREIAQLKTIINEVNLMKK